jgi:hypothetical protein
MFWSVAIACFVAGATTVISSLSMLTPSENRIICLRAAKSGFIPMGDVRRFVGFGKAG